MGWNYKYLILPRTPIDTLAQSVVKFGFDDMTKIQRGVNRWEKDSQKRFMVGKLPRRPPADVERFKDASYSTDFLLYALWFYKIAGQTVMMYTNAVYDFDGAWFFTALSHLYAFGYRGSVFQVSGNSITDTVSVSEYLVDDSKSEAWFLPLKTWTSPEGKYRAFMKSKLTFLGLGKIHTSLLDDPQPRLVLGKYPEGTDDSSRFKSLLRGIGVVYPD
jgi:hypothetical protein